MKTWCGFVLGMAFVGATGCVSAADDLPFEANDASSAAVDLTDDEAIGEVQQGNTFGKFVVGAAGLVLGGATGGLGGAALGWEIGSSVGDWAEDAVNGCRCERP